jgi:DHA1 family multidrug resistance protein-like MFS transporter
MVRPGGKGIGMAAVNRERASSSGNSHRGLLILLVFTFFMALGFDMIMPLVIGHYVNARGFSASSIAFALAVRQFSQQGLALIGGGLADRFDIRTLIGAGVLVRVIGFASLAFADTFPVLLLTMALIGLGGVLFEMPYQTAIAALTNEKNRPRYYSLNNTITGIAGAGAPLLGVGLLKFDFKAVCFSAAFCFLVNFAIACFMLPPVIRTGNSYPLKSALLSIAKNRSYLGFIVIMIVFWLAASQIDISYPLKAQELSGSAGGVGILYSVYAAATVALQYLLVTLLSRKLSSRQSIVLGISFIAGALLLTAFVRSTFTFLAVVVLYALGMMIARPNQQNIAASMADPHALGMYLGVNSFGFAIGKGFGAIIGGVFFDTAKAAKAGPWPWFVFSALAFASMLGFVFHQQPRPEAPTVKK